jgi:YebC/PmpR family DNA-binding regulatory protein
MSGHNKWSSIKHKKAAADAKRGKMFSRLAKEITLAAREGGAEEDMNPRLRTAVSAAKAANMPNDNIDRAIRKGTGELGGAVLEELMYEGYAPGGVAIIVSCLSDNRNRTAANVRSYFTKYNGSLAANGSVSWNFHRKSVFTIEGEDAQEEKLLDVLLTAGADAEDITVDDGVAQITAPPEAFGEVADALTAAEIKISESGIKLVPGSYTLVTDRSIARQVLRMTDAIEEDDDVQEVFTNLDMSDALAEELADE